VGAKVLVTNALGPKSTWVPKTQAELVLQAYSSGGTKWVIDSGCTNHMTGEKKMFTSCDMIENPTERIAFGGDGGGTVVGLGKVAMSINHSISDVYLVESLDYNLLSVSQLCEMGYNYLFTNEGVTVFRRGDDSIAFKGELKGRLYFVDLLSDKAQLDKCLLAKSSLSWLWHHRQAHVGMNNLNKLLKGEHILGLTNVHFGKNRICSACQAGKQVGAPHPARMYSPPQEHWNYFT
jgi:hypothetical protein